MGMGIVSKSSTLDWVYDDDEFRAMLRVEWDNEMWADMM